MSAADSDITDGRGQALGAIARNSADHPIEAFIDREVVSWHPPYARKVAALRAAMEPEARARWESTVAEKIRSNPGARDELAPSPWRNSLRVIGVVAAAATPAGILAGLGLGRGSTVLDPATGAVVIAVAGTIAVGALGGSLVRPARMGVPSRFAAGALWIATVGTLGSVVALQLRRSQWADDTFAWWCVAVAAGVLALALALAVGVSRRRTAAGDRFTDRDADHLRRGVLQSVLDETEGAIVDAWGRVDAATRASIERERDTALDSVLERDPSAIDAAWMRAVPPGIRGLPHAVDEIHSSMHLGAAQLADREAGGRYGHFVTMARREH